MEYESEKYGEDQTRSIGFKKIRNKVLGPRVCSISAGVGVFGGIVFIVFGLICVLVHSIVGRETVLDNVGALMLIAAIPMMMLGAAFMDELEKK